MDKYQLLEKIGRGSYGEAYLCVRKKDQAKFVLKTIDPTSMDQKDREDALREVHILKQLDSSYIVKYEDSFKDGSKICIVMEYCEGGDLDKRIVNGEQLSEDQIWEWFIQIGKALQYMHSARVIHRDLHAQNIFITKDNTLKVGDFGLAKAYTGSKYLMKSKSSIGAVAFNAPEMLDDVKFSDKCDVWALGCILYFMIMGQPPFASQNLLALMRQIEQAKYTSVSDRVSMELRDVVNWLLTSDPKERPNIARVMSSKILQPRVNPSLRMSSVYGYSWKGQSLVDSHGEGYKWDFYLNKHHNDARFAGLAEILTEELYARMEALEMKKLPVPLGPTDNPGYDNPGTVIFASSDWKTCERLLVLINGNGKVKAGQWSHRLMICSKDVESGTQLPYIRKALSCGYGVIVMNCNDNRPGIEGCKTREEHALYVWENYVMDASAVKIAIKSHSDGGPITAEIYKKCKTHFMRTVYAHAYTGDSSPPFPVTDYTRMVTKSWIQSKQPIGTDLTVEGQLQCVSAGDDHRSTPHRAFPSVFHFVAERFRD